MGVCASNEQAGSARGQGATSVAGSLFRQVPLTRHYQCYGRHYDDVGGMQCWGCCNCTEASSKYCCTAVSPTNIKLKSRQGY